MTQKLGTVLTGENLHDYSTIMRRTRHRQICTRTNPRFDTGENQRRAGAIKKRWRQTRRRIPAKYGDVLELFHPACGPIAGRRIEAAPGIISSSCRIPEAATSVRYTWKRSLSSAAGLVQPALKPTIVAIKTHVLRARPLPCGRPKTWTTWFVESSTASTRLRPQQRCC